jgi:hypothetical protein
MNYPITEDEIARVFAPAITEGRAIRLLTSLRVSSERRTTQRRRWDILNDDVIPHLNYEIDSRFSRLTNRNHLKMFLDTSNNSYRAIIDKIATVYKEPPRRKFKTKADTSLLAEVVDLGDLDLLAEEVNRITMALNECVVVPRVVDGRQVDFAIVRPDQCECEFSTRRRIRAICYHAQPDGYVYIDEDLIQLYDGAGNQQGPAELHGWGRVPATIYRRRVPTDGDWLGTAGEDLVSLYFDQVIYRTWIAAIGYFQSHKELAKKPSGEQQTWGVARTQEETGPHVILDGDYSVLDMRTDVGPHIEAIEAKFRRCAANYGISAEALSQSKLSSGLERLISQSGLNEVRMSSIKLFRPADRDLLENIAIVWNRGGLGRKFSTVEKLDPRIDYSEPRIIESSREQLEALKAGMDLGVMSPVDYVMGRDPDIKDRAEAKALIKNYLDEIGAVLEARRSFSTPEIGVGIEQKTQAQETGAAGGAASGEARQRMSPEGTAPQPDEEQNE